MTAFVDVEGDKVYVANAGDCRAVAGWFNEQSGTWRCDVLSEDHGGRNPKEHAR